MDERIDLIEQDLRRVQTNVMRLTVFSFVLGGMAGLLQGIVGVIIGAIAFYAFLYITRPLK